MQAKVATFVVGFAACLALLAIIATMILMLTRENRPARPLDDGLQSFVPNPTEEDRRMGREALAFYNETRHADPELRP